MIKNISKREAKDYTFFSTFFQKFCALFLFLPFYKIMYKLKVEGQENVPKDRSILVAANHLSLLDPPVISAIIGKTVAFMAKKELFDIRFLDLVIWWLGAFAVDRDKLEVSTIKTAKVVLANKHWTMALFPQGGRRRNGKLNKVNKGFITLAKLTKTDILPVGIIMKDFIIAKRPFEGDMTVKIGKIISYEKEVDEIMEEWKAQICDLAGLIDNTDEVKQLEAQEKEALLQQQEIKE
jgi:1-acyl-sn-glycerol-3-phosphate acyltransferase